MDEQEQVIEEQEIEQETEVETEQEPEQQQPEYITREAYEQSMQQLTSQFNQRLQESLAQLQQQRQRPQYRLPPQRQHRFPDYAEWIEKNGDPEVYRALTGEFGSVKSQLRQMQNEFQEYKKQQEMQSQSIQILSKLESDSEAAYKRYPKTFSGDNQKMAFKQMVAGVLANANSLNDVNILQIAKNFNDLFEAQKLAQAKAINADVTKKKGPKVVKGTPSKPSEQDGRLPGESALEAFWRNHKETLERNTE